MGVKKYNKIKQGHDQIKQAQKKILYGALGSDVIIFGSKGIYGYIYLLGVLICFILTDKLKPKKRKYVN